MHQTSIQYNNKLHTKRDIGWFQMLFIRYYRLQRGNIQSVNIRRRAKIWQNSN